VPDFSIVLFIECSRCLDVGIGWPLNRLESQSTFGIACGVELERTLRFVPMPRSDEAIDSLNPHAALRMKRPCTSTV